MAEVGEATLPVFKLGEDIVTLKVGDPGWGALTPPRVFKVHKQLPCEKITFFDKSFNGSFRESQTQSIELPEDDPDAVEDMLTWVYRDKVEIARIGKSMNFKRHIALFNLAEKYDIPIVADQTMDLIAMHTLADSQMPDTVQLEACYASTHETSKLRLFAARCFLWITANPKSCNLDAWSNDNMCEVLSKTPDFKDYYRMSRDQENKPVLDPRNAPPCDYHQHAMTEPCPYGKKKRSPTE